MIRSDYDACMAGHHALGYKRRCSLGMFLSPYLFKQSINLDHTYFDKTKSNLQLYFSAKGKVKSSKMAEV